MKETLDAWKSGLQLVIFGVLTIMAVSLVIYPNFVAARISAVFTALSEQGLETEVKVGGVTIKQSEGQQDVVSQFAQVEATKLRALCLTSQNCSAAEQQEIAAGLGLESVGEYQSIMVNATEIPGWVVVLGADQAEEAARFELDKVSGVSEAVEVGLMLREGYFRTVAYFNSPEAAADALPELEAAVGNLGAYVRSVTIWCEGKVDKRDGDLVICG